MVPKEIEFNSTIYESWMDTYFMNQKLRLLLKFEL